MTKEEIRYKIKEIKWARLSPAERFLIPIFNGLTEHYDGRYPNTVFYKYNGDEYFMYIKTSKIFTYDYDKIFKILRDKYNTKQYDQIVLISDMAFNILNLKVDPIYRTSLKKNKKNIFENFSIRINTIINNILSRNNLIWNITITISHIGRRLKYDKRRNQK
jgi:hypothetical protein